VSGPPPSAVAQTERALARAWVFFRVVGILGIALTALSGVDQRDHSATPAGLCIAGVVVLESILLSSACLRRRRIRSTWLAADLALTVPAQFLDSWAQSGHFGMFSLFMTPYATVVLIGLGIGLRRWQSVGAAALALGAGDFAPVLFPNPPGGSNLGYTGSPFDLVFNAAMVFYLVFNAALAIPYTLTGWAVSRRVRRSARQLDASRAETAELALQKERSWHARALHDHVLQTLEGVIRHEAIPHGALRRQIEADTAWLRALVEGVAIGQDTDLHWRLRELVERNAAGGLRVEYNGARLQRPADARATLPAEVVDAVAGAVGEALTNIAKHAKVDTAVLHATRTDHALIVSILDHGTGFDPAATRHGIGLDQSITARIREAGGHVTVDSSPGQGTYIEITIPAAAARLN
jgi:signal transduction histidine kinase